MFMEPREHWPLLPHSGVAKKLIPLINHSTTHTLRQSIPLTSPTLPDWGMKPSTCASAFRRAWLRVQSSVWMRPFSWLNWWRRSGNKLEWNTLKITEAWAKKIKIYQHIFCWKNTPFKINETLNFLSGCLFSFKNILLASYIFQK